MRKPTPNEVVAHLDRDIVTGYLDWKKHIPKPLTGRKLREREALFFLIDAIAEIQETRIKT